MHRSCINELLLVNHSDLNLRMRRILIDWLLTVSDSFSYMKETTHLGVAILDLYLSSSQNISRKTFQCVGLTSLYIASKITEEIVCTSDDLVYICDNAYSKKTFLDMEKNICRSIDYNVMLSHSMTNFASLSKNISKDNISKILYYLDCILFEPSILYKYDIDDLIESSIEIVCQKGDFRSDCMEKILQLEEDIKKNNSKQFEDFKKKYASFIE